MTHYRHTDPDQLQQRLSFTLPKLLSYGILGFTATHFYGYLVVTQPWFSSIHYGIWAIALAVLALIGLKCWQSYRAGQPMLDPATAKLLILVVTLLIALTVGGSLAFYHLASL
ncbi:hypothetical protein HY772_10225 [Candidatus Woesearchaeota archaeon]|nr:hypothetical protein [Candidatus Woesearchaeota archaeon]